MKKISKKLVVLSAFVLVFALAISPAIAKNEKSNKGEESSKKEKVEKVKKIKEFEKATKEKTNAQIHKSKTDEVAETLKNVGKAKALQAALGEGEESTEVSEEGSEGEVSEEIAEEAEEIAEDVEEGSEIAAEAIEGVEKENKFKRFLVGTDYKNLGQLRSSLAHNENQIRKITKLSEKAQVQGAEVDGLVEDQLVVLMQERERIKTVLQEGEEAFSVLGWFGKMFGIDTTSEPIDESKEEEIQEEVLETLEEEDEEMEDDDSMEGEDENEGEEGSGEVTEEVLSQ